MSIRSVVEEFLALEYAPAVPTCYHCKHEHDICCRWSGRFRSEGVPVDELNETYVLCCCNCGTLNRPSDETLADRDAMDADEWIFTMDAHWWINGRFERENKRKFFDFKDDVGDTCRNAACTASCATSPMRVYPTSMTKTVKKLLARNERPIW